MRLNGVSIEAVQGRESRVLPGAHKDTPQPMIPAEVFSEAPHPRTRQIPEFRTKIGHKESSQAQEGMPR
ncbi:hypothetical protein E2C01_086701 [Portunus trituberculatus]|uniref:Uncharacterized protein n=1 Tax=Portunus trituberculatus TaxID=210409 RepID=A0A5B7JA12_PORTR|nr:hypothetical protein [Portunus trituberculatus]